MLVNECVVRKCHYIRLRHKCSFFSLYRLYFSSLVGCHKLIDKLCLKEKMKRKEKHLKIKHCTTFIMLACNNYVQ